MDGCTSSAMSESSDQQMSVVKQKEIELKEMQDQIESYNQMVIQLASQREMAVKKLVDMDTQIEELNKILETQRVQVEAKDKDLKTKRSQLQTLKNEENELKEKFDEYKRELNVTTENLSNTRLTETQIRAKLKELQNFLSSTNAAIDDIEKAISIKDTIKLSALCNQVLAPPPLSVNTLLTNGMRSNSTTSPGSGQLYEVQPQMSQPQHQATNLSDNKNDPIFDSSINFDPFADDDPFEGDDPFVPDALPEDDPFNPSSSNASSAFVIAQDDPFAPLTS